MEGKKGLRDVAAGETRLCQLDEKNQQLYYCGYSIADLAREATFEEVAYLMLYGKLPATAALLRFNSDLIWSAVNIPEEVLDCLNLLPADAHPMDKLSLLVRADGNTHRIPFAAQPEEASLKLAKHLIARLPSFVAFLGGANLSAESEADSTLVGNFIRDLKIDDPDGSAARAMNAAFILYTEHEFNAGTFAVRVAASAHTDMYSAILGGIGTLRGVRHGGANEEVMKMAEQIGDPAKVREYCDRFLEKPGARLPGFGHAVYTVADPRVAVLKPMVKELSEKKKDSRWYEIVLALEEYMAERSRQKGKPLPANTDLWTAPLYRLLGIPTYLFTPLFAAARVAGWCGHYLEVRYRYNEPILRPRAQYSGENPRPFPSLEEREEAEQ